MGSVLMEPFLDGNHIGLQPFQELAHAYPASGAVSRTCQMHLFNQSCLLGQLANNIGKDIDKVFKA